VTDSINQEENSYDITAHLYSLFTGALFSIGGMTEDTIRKKAYIEILSLEGNERILDICCATGKGTRIIASMTPNGQIFGIDLNPKMLAFAAAKSKSYKNLKFRVGDCSKIPFGDNTFDLVTASLALHELPTKLLKEVFGEIRRVLKKNGRIFVLDFTLPQPLPSYLRYFYYILRIIEDESAARFMMINQEKLFVREKFTLLKKRHYYGKLLTAALYKLNEK